ncbi:ATP-binding cassette domain-containing protein [Paracoccus nototheniae]|uniref:Nickel import system ATP-binding protein NikD n=1 Tax=Paracoccus nototheniae TaxID=2489002 RepID=A0ABW4E333_9RHOB|nr:ATP-binding cassette domain-containing protein [Paracoccus nototheniae]
MSLRVRDLSLGFSAPDGLWRRRETWLVQGLNLDVAAGRITALIGASGAGKSLLAHAILGALPGNALQTGRIAVQGRTVFLPQQGGWLDPTARIGDQIAWAARRKACPAQVADRLALLDLGSAVAALYPHQLSGGMARRVLMVMALIGPPALLVADEPTAGLDPASSALLLATLRAYAAEGGAVLLITHDLIAALPIADEVAMLADGRLHPACPAQAFAGDGAVLPAAARRQWQALPQNGFTDA